MKYRVLIVEDEVEIVNLITKRLDRNIYELDVATDGFNALELIEKNFYDLVTLDIMLPNLDGLSICKELRQVSKETLIIVVSALDLQESKEKAYNLGADDYIPKPFSAKLLALKIETLLKRRFELTKTHYRANKILHYDEALKTFSILGENLSLTLSEYTILEVLYKNQNRVFSNDELSQILYDLDVGNILQTGIKTHIYSLRKKIARFFDQELIKTIRNRGYTLHEN
ncbi:response regulator transcription factor [Sulfurimonas sp.]|uniref:response regulator transcription factor n=1 Tax=Sulfurimonas sp. TaxID=2022749 RepID=UPI003D0BA8FD